MANVMEDHFDGECHDSFYHAVCDSHDANHDEDFHTSVEWYRRGGSRNDVEDDHHNRKDETSECGYPTTFRLFKI